MLHWVQGNLRLSVHINASERFALKPAHAESVCVRKHRVSVQEQERQRQMLLLSHKGKESFQSNQNSNVDLLQLMPWDLQV